jgi:hypothetical protein
MLLFVPAGGREHQTGFDKANNSEENLCLIGQSSCTLPYRFVGPTRHSDLLVCWLFQEGICVVSAV